MLIAHVHNTNTCIIFCIEWNMKKEVHLLLNLKHFLLIFTFFRSPDTQGIWRNYYNKVQSTLSIYDDIVCYCMNAVIKIEYLMNIMICAYCMSNIDIRSTKIKNNLWTMNHVFVMH